MPHRIHLLTQAHYPDPLIDYASTEFILEFKDAASLLRQWRNPFLGRSNREGTIMNFAANAKASVEAIQDKLLTTIMDSDLEKEYIDQLKVYRFLLERTLPEALELVNLDKLLTPEDIEEFIKKHLQLMGQEYGTELGSARSILNQLNSITDVEVTDKFGRKKRISRSDVLDVIGSVLGNILIRQTTLWPVDNIIPRPRGRLHLKKTYKQAILREAKLPPKEIESKDIRVVDKDRLSIVYFILDLSQSMSKKVFKDGLTRLDGALLTSLGLYYYFKVLNRRKRREFDSFNMHMVPVTKSPYVISDDSKFEDFVLKSEAKGKTRLVHATFAAIQHATDNYKDNNFDVQLVYLTDGMPNVPFETKLPGNPAKFLSNYFKNTETSTPKDARDCMIQLNQLFQFLKNKKDRNWNISYFLMAETKFVKSDLYKDTRQMLNGICRPVLIDPTEVDSLGKRILKETILNE